MNNYRTQLYSLWQGERSLDAGQLLCESLPKDDHSRLAASILRLFEQQNKSELPALQQLAHIVSNPGQWTKAKHLFELIRDDVLQLESLDFPDHAQRDSLYRLYIAENIAKVIYNATDPTEAFDDDAGWWIVKCLRDYVDFLGDDDFAAKAWDAIASCSDGLPA